MTGITEDGVLYALKSSGALTAAALGERLDVTSMGARQHLLRLEAAGLVASQFKPAARGRPKQFWSLTQAGHGRFPDRHSDLTLELINSVHEVFGADGLEKLIRAREKTSLKLYRSELSACTGLKAKVAQLARLRDREGYMTEWRQLPGGKFLLIENHCPICAAATQCQLFCRSELTIFRTALGRGVKVERVEHVLDGARRCAYEIVAKVEAK